MVAGAVGYFRAARGGRSALAPRYCSVNGAVTVRLFAPEVQVMVYVPVPCSRVAAAKNQVTPPPAFAVFRPRPSAAMGAPEGSLPLAVQLALLAVVTVRLPKRAELTDSGKAGFSARRAPAPPPSAVAEGIGRAAPGGPEFWS